MAKTTPQSKELGLQLQEQSKAIVNVDDLPDFMREDAREGTDDLNKFQTTPRISIVQSQSSPDRKEEYGEGTVNIFPDGIPIAAKDEEFTCIPLIFWASWEKRSDIMDTNSPMIVEVSHDETSDIARCCKTKDLRNQPYPDNPSFSYKYVENLNFIVLIDSGPAAGEFGTISFNGGEHYTGQKLCSMLKRRPCSIYGNRIALRAVMRTRQNKAWYGFDFNNPADGAVVDNKEKYLALKDMHSELAEMVKSNKLVVNREDEATVEDSADALAI